MDTDSELVHIVRDTGVHVADVIKFNSLLHGEDTVVFTDAGFQGADKRLDAKPGLFWQVAMRPGKRQNLDEASSSIDALMDKVEKLEVRIWAKVEHPFRVVKKQLGCVKARYRGLKKNILQLKGAVWAVQFMDGQASLDCNARISASQSRRNRPEHGKRLKTNWKMVLKSLNWKPAAPSEQYLTGARPYFKLFKPSITLYSYQRLCKN